VAGHAPVDNNFNDTMWTYLQRLHDRMNAPYELFSVGPAAVSGFFGGWTAFVVFLCGKWGHWILKAEI
jgi:hypothetical protein